MPAGPTSVRDLPAARVTEASFAPFGRVLVLDDADPDRRVVARYRNGQEPMPSIIHEDNPDGVPTCTWLARHHDQTQALTPIDGPIVVVVVPAGLDPRSADGAAAAAAFVADVGEGIQLDEGVWHWAASVGRGRVRVANLQGHRWPEDNEIAALEPGPAWRPRHEWLDRHWAAELLAVGTPTLASAHGGAPEHPTDAPGTARRLDDGRWLVVDAHGAVELDDADALEAIRDRQCSV